MVHEQYNTTAHGCAVEYGLPFRAGNLQAGHWSRCFGVLVQSTNTLSGYVVGAPAPPASAMVERYIL
jgi:hypothetical protein